MEKEHKHESVLFKVAGQSIQACATCGKRTRGNGYIDLKIANRITSEDKNDDNSNTEKPTIVE